MDVLYIPIVQLYMYSIMYTYQIKLDEIRLFFFVYIRVIITYQDSITYYNDESFKKITVFYNINGK